MPQPPEPARPLANPPQYPQSSPATEPPLYPGTPTSAPEPPQKPQETQSDPVPEQAPDDLDYQNIPGKRVHYKAYQRGTDATALGQLALLLPGFFMSLIVVLFLSVILALTGLPIWLPVLAWIGSGALIFHRPTEDYLARYLLRLRRPMPQEAARLEPVWHEVTSRAGVEGKRYELWVENSQDLNAYAAAGHIVGVTEFALERLPSAQLAAILAHELGHHTGGHAWTSLLGYWYSLPGRVTWRVIRKAVSVAFALAGFFSSLAAVALVVGIGGFALASIAVLHGLPLVLLVVPYLIAAVGRRAELRADQHAAALGFAPDLAEVLQTMHTMDRQAHIGAAAAFGQRPAQPGVLAKLLASHPDFPTRLERLRPYLEPQR